MMLTNEVIRISDWLVYHRHGEEHRIDGPSSLRANEVLVWEMYGEYHRIGAPAVIWKDGQTAYYNRGFYDLVC